MRLPSFDEFLAARKPEPGNTFDILSGEYDVLSSEGLARLVGEIILLSQQRQQALLRDYHEWLCQQLDHRA